jgi:hypothetical protein
MISPSQRQPANQGSVLPATDCGLEGCVVAWHELGKRLFYGTIESPVSRWIRALKREEGGGPDSSQCWPDWLKSALYQTQRFTAAAVSFGNVLKQSLA